MEQTISLLTQWKREKGVKEASFLNFSVTDGHTVIVTRFIDDPEAEPASLYYASGTEYRATQTGEYYYFSPLLSFLPPLQELIFLYLKVNTIWFKHDDRR